MFRTVERHVLQQMRQTTLVLVLVNRTHLLGNVEVGHMLRIAIVTNVVCQAVIQFSHAHLLVLRNCRHHLGLSPHTNEQQRCQE